MAAASVALAGCGDDSGASTTQASCVLLSDGTCAEETFQNPPVLQPNAEGVHELSLAATEVVLEGQRHCVRAYNGAYLAPTIETPARVGDEQRRVRVDLANRLTTHAYRSLEGGRCTCTDLMGDECVPDHVHDRCVEDTGRCQCVDEAGEPCLHMFDFNVTNLHAHGAHVRPDFSRGGDACVPTSRDGIYFACRDCGDDVCGDEADDACYRGDDVLSTFHVGTGARYRWDVDEDGTHHTGLQWYHPHIHGTTAIQVASGAAGAWIVRGELDSLPGIVDARERVMVLSTPSIATNGFTPLADGVTCTEETLTFDDFSVLGQTTAPQRNLVNGVRRPRMITPPGQVERWRILDAGYLDEMFLGVFRGADADCSSFSTLPEDTLRLTQIGRDGLILPEPYEDDYVFLSSGYRVEAMIGGEDRLRDGETWCVVSARFLQEGDDRQLGEFVDGPISPGRPPSQEELFLNFASDGDVIAILNVSSSAGSATTRTLPDYAAVGALAPSRDLGGRPIAELCAEAAAVADPTEIDQVAVLQVGFWTVDDPDPCDCENYNVNCQNFELTDRERYPFDRDLPLDAVEHWRVQSSFDGHPFHIHINPFVVCPEPDNVFEPIPFPHFRDTYHLNLHRRLDMITQNRMFTGPYVLHCHKLTHEDHGMMELLRVCDPATDETCGDFGWRTCDEDDLACIQGRAATECAISATGEAETAACISLLGGPGGVCGPNACVADEECDPGRCEGNVCQPG